MNTEVDLVRAFMAVEAATSDELGRARTVLDDAIAQEQRQEEERQEEQQQDVAATGGALVHSRSRRFRRSVRWAIPLAVSAAVVAAIAVVAPSARTPTAPAAAAEIARLADAVAPVPALAPGQWYQYQLEGVLTANVTSGTKTAPINATATIPIDIGAWSNSTQAICTSEEFGMVTFPTPASAQAWQTMGLLTTPANQPATGCSAGHEASIGGGGTPLGPIDVSSITHDPATLANELENGSTGISDIDHYAAGEPAHVVGFLRLTDLLVGPLKGQWPGFGREILQTMALLPGIESLGPLISHSGTQGPAFSMPTQVVLNPTSGTETGSFTAPTVILDGSTGALLEVRNFDYPVLGSAAEDFVGSSSALVFSEGVGYGTTAEWIDPGSGLQAIDQSSLPAWIGTFHIIEAVTPASTTESQLSDEIDPFLGHGNSSFSDSDTPSAGETTYDITIMGSLASAESVVNTLTSSGLFLSVSLQL